MAHDIIQAVAEQLDCGVPHSRSGLHPGAWGGLTEGMPQRLLGGNEMGRLGLSPVLCSQVLQERYRSSMSSLCPEPPALELGSLGPSDGSGRQESSFRDVGETVEGQTGQG